jgi:hypothetical protein
MDKDALINELYLRIDELKDHGPEVGYTMAILSTGMSIGFLIGLAITEFLF